MINFWKSMYERGVTHRSAMAQQQVLWLPVLQCLYTVCACLCVRLFIMLKGNQLRWVVLLFWQPVVVIAHCSWFPMLWHVGKYKMWIQDQFFFHFPLCYEIGHFTTRLCHMRTVFRGFGPQVRVVPLSMTNLLIFARTKLNLDNDEV